MASDDTLAGLQNELPPVSVALLPVELNLCSLACVKGDILYLLVGRVVSDTHACDLLVIWNL